MVIKNIFVFTNGNKNENKHKSYLVIIDGKYFVEIVRIIDLYKISINID